MIKPLNSFLTEGEIQHLIRHFVFNAETNVGDIIEKLKRERIYEARKHSHSINSRKLTFTEKDFERVVWNYFIRQQLQSGKTTGDLSKELGKTLDFLNSFF